MYEGPSRSPKEQSFKVLHYLREEMMNAEDTDSINKWYRQGRIRNRFQYFITFSCSYEMYSWFNRKLKSYRADARRALR